VKTEFRCPFRPSGDLRRVSLTSGASRRSLRLMSDVPPTPDVAVSVEGLSAEARRLRSANSRLRDVVASKDELLAGQDGLISLSR
jgi:hypothetical protein